MNEVRTYMAFNFPVDTIKLRTVPDMDLSYGLASTLVRWDTQKQISASLAVSWKTVAPNLARFKLREGAVWSDGTSLTSAQVKSSLQNALARHPDDLRSLSRLIESIECPSASEIEFKLKAPASLSDLLGKFTEPNFGILRWEGPTKIDYSVTTGPFFLERSSDEKELRLHRNAHWFGAPRSGAMADRVTIRTAPQSMDTETILLNDSWPNLMETSSLISEETLKEYKSRGFNVWTRPLDKFFSLQIGKRMANAEGLAVARFLRQKLNVNDVVHGLSGFSLRKQIFPEGYQLSDPNFKCSNDAEVSLPEKYKKKPLHIVITPARVNSTLRENIRRAIKNATGIEPKITEISLQEVRTYKSKGDFDFYFGRMGLADPDPEGAMSAYLEGDAPLILPDGNNYISRLDIARHENTPEKKLTAMRAILTDAVCTGYILPLLHLATIGIGRSELDLSEVPAADESVTLSKIRFKADGRGAKQ